MAGFWAISLGTKRRASSLALAYFTLDVMRAAICGSSRKLMKAIASSLCADDLRTHRLSCQIVPPSLGITYLMDGRSSAARKTVPLHPWARATSPETSSWSPARSPWPMDRSEEHTSELQSRLHLVCRLLLEKKKKKYTEVQANHT